MRNKALVWVVYGDKAALEARFSRDAASRWSGYEQHTITRDYGAVSNKIASRHAKTTLLRHLPYVDDLLYLDADTRINGKVDHVFGVLDDGWDIVMTASTNQDTDLMWHLQDSEAETTLKELGYLPLALQCGVMWIRRSPLTEAFFEIWHEEWMRFGDEDQGAFLRALSRVPVKIWLLGRPFNGGAVIEHRFGMVRS